MAALAEHLSYLESYGLIRRAAEQPELEYLFRHALIQEAAYESLLKADRRILHRAVAETLERLYPEQRTELAATLGHHFAAAGEAERGHHYFKLAGEHALTQYANAEAEQHFRAALSLAVSEADRAHLLSGLGEALVWQSRFAEAVSTWREAITLYQISQQF
jgi:predicted ATPase